jgi:hypothetical protein
MPKLPELSGLIGLADYLTTVFLNFSFLYGLEIGSGAHPASSSLGSGGSFCWDKAT